MKKFAYWLAIVIASLIISLNPIQAARQIPGTAPELPPLQPIPEDAQPNYSGSFGTNDPEIIQPSTDSESTDDQNNNAQISENEESALATITPQNQEGSQLWIWLAAVVVAALIAGTWYWFRSRQQGPSSR